MRSRRLARTAALALCALTFAVDADARRFQMSGSWELRRGQVFLPLQFAMAKGPYMMDLSTMGFGFPHGPVLGMGWVDATGSGPATLRVPAHRFGGDYATLVPLAGVTLVQITTMIAADGPVAPAALAPGAGPGSFTWCPGDPECTALEPIWGAGTRDGRVVYSAGANQFGGVIRMLLQGGGWNSFLFDQSPFQVGHVPFGQPGTQATGGSYASTLKNFQAVGIVTQPLVVPATNAPVTAPGPKLTTMLGVTTTGAGPVWHFPALGITSMGMPFGHFTTQTGFAFTTGTVLVQQGTYSGPDTFTLVGSDMRTALGAGNITLVAGGLAVRNTLAGTTRYPTFGRIRMSFAPPVPSLSPAGLAAAGTLMLLAVAYALRRSYS